MNGMQIVSWEGDAYMVKLYGKEAAYIYFKGAMDNTMGIRFLDKDASFSARQLRKIADFMENGR